MRSWELECKTYNRFGAHTNLPIAMSYFAVFDKDASRYLILLEDLTLRSENMQTGNLTRGLIDQELNENGKIIKSEIGIGVIAFEKAARFHARHWNKTLKHNCIEYARSFGGPYYKVMLADMY